MSALHSQLSVKNANPKESTGKKITPPIPKKNKNKKNKYNKKGEKKFKAAIFFLSEANNVINSKEIGKII